MNDVKHTPGPWRIEHGLIKGASDVQTNGKLRNMLGISSASYSEIVCDIHGNIELEAPQANARLIAAAPDLLEVCILAHDVLATSDDWPQLVTYLYAAITKAKAI
jgi:hypothetical protein